MAHITKEETAKIRAELKKAFPNLKFSVRTENYSKVNVAIMEGDVDFSDILGEREHMSINEFYTEKYGKHAEMFSKMIEIMRGDDWFDESDPMTDYFHCKHYLNLAIGKWDKPYKLREPKAKKVA